MLVTASIRHAPHTKRGCKVNSAALCLIDRRSPRLFCGASGSGAASGALRHRSRVGNVRVVAVCCLGALLSMHGLVSWVSFVLCGSRPVSPRPTGLSGCEDRTPKNFGLARRPLEDHDSGCAPDSRMKTCFRTQLRLKLTPHGCAVEAVAM